jgi:hypothetical protein
MPVIRRHTTQPNNPSNPMSTQTQTHIDLKVGDIRQLGDEVRHRTGVKDFYASDADRHGKWRPVSLIGHPILSADLIATELRRPL